MLTAIGLGIILVIVVLLMTERLSPVISLIVIPFVGALLAGFGPSELADFYQSGTRSVLQVVILFVFAILFFGVMNDVGLFRPMIHFLVTVTRGNVVAVAVGTVLVSAIAQLDGAGASTFLLIVPPLLPLYQRLKMSPYLLFLLLAASAGVVNILPWGGPLGRLASVLEVDVVALWRPLIGIQIFGLILLCLLAFGLGKREQRRIIKAHGQLVTREEADTLASQTSPEQPSTERIALDAATEALLRPKLLWFNFAIFVLTLVVLFAGWLPPGYVFMLALSVALLLNYPKPAMQLARIQAHAGGAIMMASIILAAGTFLGILRESGMLNSIALALVDVLPQALLPYLHLVIGFLGTPLELVLSTDAYYFALFPVVHEITAQVGVSSASAAYAMLLGSIVGTFISPFSPALWLGLGLARLSMGVHIRYSFFWIWGVSLVLLAISVLMGVI
ncbi:MAG: citrate transporter [Neisseriaceae bacterium]|nr:citrate transporter [Neisseriaceae bacterium]